MYRTPAKFRRQPRTVDCISEIMSRAVGHEFDQIGIGAFGRRTHNIKYIADTVNNLKVGALRITTDVVSISHLAGFEHGLNGGTMVFHMKPVADVGARPIYGKCLTGQRVECYQRNEFFGELTWTVVIRTVSDQCGETVGFMEGSDKVVTGSLRSRVRAVRAIRSYSGEGRIAGLKSPEHLVCGDM